MAELLRSGAEIINIRPVSNQSLAGDLATGRLVLPGVVSRSLGYALSVGNISFFVAEAEADGSPRGQAGVNWLSPLRDGPVKEKLAGVPNVAFVEVPEGHRRQGIGSAIMAVVVQEAQDRGCGQLMLSVGHENPDGRRFWEREGFAPVPGLEAVEYTAFRKDEAGNYGAQPVPCVGAYFVKELPRLPS
ncbi:MAG TPA: GNAT family N-acetyltransferase [Candidatus Saccharimonadales bacterium]|nr:GNAT family N-acetyltransferase [Candidatus Saccharimonadales bacterium]